MHVTLHAVTRFRERVLLGCGETTDWEIEDLIRFTRHGRFLAYLTQRSATDPAPVTRYLFEGEHAGRWFYVATTPAGDIAKTILTAPMIARWTTQAIAQRIPQPHRPTPVPSRSWRIVYPETS